MVVDLNFKTVMDWHPFFTGFDGNADEDTGIVVFVTHSKNYVDHAVADFSAGPVKQAHAAVCVNQAIFDGIAAGAYMLPARQIFSIEEWLPFGGVALAGILIFVRRKRKSRQTAEQCSANNETFQHGVSPGFRLQQFS
jgi:hypothetical protein